MCTLKAAKNSTKPEQCQPVWSFFVALCRHCLLCHFVNILWPVVEHEYVHVELSVLHSNQAESQSWSGTIDTKTGWLNQPNWAITFTISHGLEKKGFASDPTRHFERFAGISPYFTHLRSILIGLQIEPLPNIRVVALPNVGMDHSFRLLKYKQTKLILTGSVGNFISCGAIATFNRMNIPRYVL